MGDSIKHGRFQTEDIDLATALSLKYPIIDGVPNPVNPRKVIFAFQTSPELETYVRDYRLKKTLVEPREFYFQLRDVRSQINEILSLNNNNDYK